MSKQNAVHVSQLEFVAVNEKNQITSMWSVKPTGDYTRDNETGRAYGAECLEFVARTGNLPVLGYIVRDMIAAGQYEGIEIGFMYMVGAHIVLHGEPLLADHMASLDAA